MSLATYIESILILLVSTQMETIDTSRLILTHRSQIFWGNLVTSRHHLNLGRLKFLASEPSDNMKELLFVGSISEIVDIDFLFKTCVH
jgi:hypothetical protein